MNVDQIAHGTVQATLNEWEQSFTGLAAMSLTNLKDGEQASTWASHPFTQPFIYSAICRVRGVPYLWDATAQEGTQQQQGRNQRRLAASSGLVSYVWRALDGDRAHPTQAQQWKGTEVWTCGVEEAGVQRLQTHRSTLSTLLRIKKARGKILLLLSW